MLFVLETVTLFCPGGPPAPGCTLLTEHCVAQTKVHSPSHHCRVLCSIHSPLLQCLLSISYHEFHPNFGFVVVVCLMFNEYQVFMPFSHFYLPQNLSEYKWKL